MATTPPTPPNNQPPGTPPPAASDNAFTKMLIRLGVAAPSDFAQDLAPPLSKLEAQIRAFNQSTEFKDSFFAKLPGVSGIISKILPDVSRATAAMITFGQASRAGEDGGAFYNNLGMIGKLLVNITPDIQSATGATAGFGATVRAVFSTGILAIITVVIAAFAQLAKIFKFVALTALDFQDEINKMNVLLGGLARDRVNAFTQSLNGSLKATMALGMGMQATFDSIKGFIQGGINPAIAFQSNLIATTGMLSKVTGIAADSMAQFFAKLMVGSKVSADNIRSLGNAFVNINRIAEESGVLATVSFNDVQEAVNSVGTALLLASNRGSTFTDRMTKDLVSLTTLTKTLGLSVGELNSKFEEAGNLLSNQDSGFRSLLAISGGATVSQMLNNSFNKTDAMLKISSTLERLNVGLRGNLNLMGQVAQEAFGISKEAAIKYATMTQEQKDAIIRTQTDMERLRKDGVQEAYNSVTGTLTETWEKFKNVMMQGFQRAMGGNTGVQSFLGKMSDKLNEWIQSFADENGPAAKFIEKLENAFTWVASKLEWLFDNLVPIMERIGNWFNDIVNTASQKNGLVTMLGSFLGNVLIESLKFLFTATIGSGTFWLGVGGAILGGIVGAFLGPAGSIAGMKIGAAIGGAVGVGVGITSGDSEDNSAFASSNRNALLDPIKKHLSNELASIKKEKDSYAGLKDTDAVIGKDGKISLAGLERIKLEEQEERLVDSQSKLRESTDTLVDSNNRLIEALNALAPDQRNKAQQYIQASDPIRTPNLQSGKN